MTEKEAITELDMNKYLVIKRDDLRYLSIDLQAAMAQIVANINHSRKLIDNKPQNKYLVLNLDDDIDMLYFEREMEKHPSYTEKVSDIAVPLVNAILKAKKE